MFRLSVSCLLTFPSHFPVQFIAPEFIQISGFGCFCLHLQPVGHHTVKRFQDAVKSGQDAQMFLNVIRLFISEYSRRHILVLDPLIGDHCRRQIPLQIHLLKSSVILLCDFVVAFPQFLGLCKCKIFHPCKKLCRLIKEDRHASARQSVGVNIHFFRW